MTNKGSGVWFRWGRSLSLWTYCSTDFSTVKRGLTRMQVQAMISAVNAMSFAAKMATDNCPIVGHLAYKSDRSGAWANGLGSAHMLPPTDQHNWPVVRSRQKTTTATKNLDFRGL